MPACGYCYAGLRPDPRFIALPRGLRPPASFCTRNTGKRTMQYGIAPSDQLALGSHRCVALSSVAGEVRISQ